MKRLAVTMSLVAALGIASIAQAQATRTWVSGVGDDVNPCSRTAPCKTFAGAISKTAVGGEIDALDPGGFGAVTITKSMTIDGGPNAGGILAAGTSAVTINAAGGAVTLRNLSMNGSNFAGTLHGVRILAAAKVAIDHCEIYNFGSRGISIETSANVKVVVHDTVIRNNLSSGIVAAPSAGEPQLTVDNSNIYFNGAHGIDIVSLSDAHISNTSLTNNVSAGFITEQASNTAAIESCFIANNAIGIQAGVGGQAAAVNLSRSMVIRNLTQGILISNGPVLGFQNNVITNNVGNSNVSSSQAQQ